VASLVPPPLTRRRRPSRTRSSRWTGMAMEIRVVDAIRFEVRDSSPPKIA
jgi:hypothetical protein